MKKGIVFLSVFGLALTLLFANFSTAEANPGIIVTPYSYETSE